MKVLITGCNGLLACGLTKQLLRKGTSVWGTSLSGLTNPYLPAEKYLAADLTNPASAEELLEKVQPHVLVHAAALTKPDACELSPESCYALNHRASVELIEAASQRGVRVIYLSTDFIFSGQNPPHEESSQDFPPVNEYGRSKRLTEEFILSGHPGAAIVRTALVYGYEPLLPRGNIFTWLLQELSAGRPVRVVRDQFRTPTFSDDLARGLSALCKSDSAGIFHLAGKDFVSVYDFALQVADVFDLDSRLITPVETLSLNEPARRPPQTRLLYTRAQSELGYQPGTLEENLRKLKMSMSS
jgi:dTDP-4-dehydrorhamnose reductase